MKREFKDYIKNAGQGNDAIELIPRTNITFYFSDMDGNKKEKTIQAKQRFSLYLNEQDNWYLLLSGEKIIVQIYCKEVNEFIPITEEQIEMFWDSCYINYPYETDVIREINVNNYFKGVEKIEVKPEEITVRLISEGLLSLFELTPVEEKNYSDDYEENMLWEGNYHLIQVGPVSVYAYDEEYEYRHPHINQTITNEDVEQLKKKWSLRNLFQSADGKIYNIKTPLSTLLVVKDEHSEQIVYMQEILNERSGSTGILTEEDSRLGENYKDLTKKYPLHRYLFEQ